MNDLISQVKNLHAAFMRGEIRIILERVAPDVSWEYEGPPEIMNAGIRRSREEVAEFFLALAAQYTDYKLEMTEYLSSDDAVAAFGRFQATVTPVGIRVDTPVAQFFKFRDGKVVRFIQLTNTSATLEAIINQNLNTGR